MANDCKVLYVIYVIYIYIYIYIHIYIYIYNSVVMAHVQVCLSLELQILRRLIDLENPPPKLLFSCYPDESYIFSGLRDAEASHLLCLLPDHHRFKGLVGLSEVCQAQQNN